MTRKQLLETVERFKFAPLDLSKVQQSIDKRTKLGGWIVQETNQDARAELLDEYDTAVIVMNNAMLIQGISTN